jgi:hypothetical protein
MLPLACRLYSKSLPIHLLRLILVCHSWDLSSVIWHTDNQHGITMLSLCSLTILDSFHNKGLSEVSMTANSVQHGELYSVDTDLHDVFFIYGLIPT